MTGFFARMGERALGAEGGLRLRLPEPYEGTSEPRWGEVAGGAPAPLAEARVPVLSHRPESGPAQATYRRAASLPADGGRRTTTPARADRPEPAPAVASGEAVRSAVPTPTYADEPSEPRTAPAAPDTEPTHDAPVAGHRPMSPPPPDLLVPVDVSPGDVPAGHEAHERVGTSLAPDAPSEPPSPTMRPAAQKAGSPLDLAELLRRHVFPALAANGVLEPGEVPELVEPCSPSAPPAGRRTPAPGAVTVQPGVMSIRQSVAEAATSVGVPERVASPEVHVHIDRITVTRAAPPAPPPPAPAAPRHSSVSDHAAYLARRRERR